MYSLPIIVAFYEQIDVFMLVLVRTVAFFVLMPVISGMNIPMLVRLTVALFIAAGIFMAGGMTVPVGDPTLGGFFMMVVIEFLAGAMMGYVVFFVFNALLLAGHIMDFMMGMMMANSVDPLTQIQVPIVGNLFYMVVMALLVVTGGLAMFIQLFADSFLILPLGSAFILGNQPIAQMLIVQMTAFMVLAVRISMPIMGALMVINIALGIMVKAAPQMNVFVIGMPLKILIGFILLMTNMVGQLSMIYNWLFEGALNILIDLIMYMEPVVIEYE